MRRHGRDRSGKQPPNYYPHGAKTDDKRELSLYSARNHKFEEEKSSNLLNSLLYFPVIDMPL